MSETGLENLARSMKEVGLCHPIGVRKEGEVYNLVYGARRLAAAKMLEWEDIEVMVVDVGEEGAEILKVVENREREDVNAIDEGTFYRELLIAKNWTQVKLAEMLQVSPGFISQRVNACEWPKSLREAVENGALSFSTAREIAGIKDYEHLLYIVVHAAKNGATPSVAREWKRRANLDYAAKLRADAGDDGEGEMDARPEPQMYCNTCGDQVPVKDTSGITVCTECRELIEEVKKQGLFKENKEKGEVSEKETG